MKKWICYVLQLQFLICVFLLIGASCLSIESNSSSLIENESESITKESVSVTKLSNWDGFYGAAFSLDSVDNLLFVGGFNDYGAMVVDISYFSLPTVVSVYNYAEGEETFTRDITVSNDGSIVYLGTDAGLIILNYNNVTNEFTKIGEYLGVTDIKEVDLHNDLCFLVTTYDGLVIVDVSDPSSPMFLGQYDPAVYFQDGDYYNDTYAIIDQYSNMRLVNVSDPSSPTLLTSLGGSGQTYDIKVDNGIAYVSNMYEGLEIINITNKFSLQKLGNYSNVQHGAFEVAVTDDVVFLIDTYMFIIIDVSDKTNPQKIEQFYPQVFGRLNSPIVDRNFIYFINEYTGLEMFDIFDLYNPVPVGSLPIQGYATFVTIADNTAFVAGANLTMVAVNIENPTNPTPIGYYVSGMYCWEIDIHNNYAYLYGDPGKIEIVNLLTPFNFVSNYTSSSVITGLALSNQYAYVSTIDGIEIVNVSDPSNLVLLDVFTGITDVRDIQIQYNYLYARTSYDIYVYDISTPTVLNSLDSYTIPAFIFHMSTSSSRLALTTLSDLYVFDITTPANLVLMDTYSSGYFVQDVHVWNNIVFTAEWDFGVRIFNTSIPDILTEILTIPNANDYVFDIFVNEDYICLAKEINGIDIYSYDISSIPFTPPTTGGFTGDNLFLWIGLGATAGILLGFLPLVLIFGRRFLIARRERLKIEAAMSKFYSCYSCGYPIDKDSIVCNDCGEEVIRCTICKLPISLGDSVGKCSLCDSLGHLDHLQEWVEDKKKCPHCLQEIPPDSIIPVVPDEKFSKKMVN